VILKMPVASHRKMPYEGVVNASASLTNVRTAGAEATLSEARAALKSLAAEGVVGDLRERDGLALARVHPLDWRSLTPTVCFWWLGRHGQAITPARFSIKGLSARFSFDRNFELPVRLPVRAVLEGEGGEAQEALWPAERTARGSLYFAATPDRHRRPLDLAAALVRLYDDDRGVLWYRGGVWLLALGPRAEFSDPVCIIRKLFT